MNSARSVGLWLATVLAACGSASGSASPSPQSLPSTHADPLPHVPAPSDTGTAGAPVGLRVRGGHGEARAIALEFVKAILRGNLPEAEPLLADRVGRTTPELERPQQTRQEAVAMLVTAAGRSPRPPSLPPLERLIRTQAITTQILAQTHPEGSVPAGYERADLLVTLPLTTAGQRVFRLLLGWRGAGRIVVRALPAPQIVAL